MRLQLIGPWFMLPNGKFGDWEQLMEMERQMAQWHAPLDPECPKVVEFNEGLFGDPMTKAMGAPTDDIMAGWERKHRAECTRCQRYGAANIEVDNG